MSVFSKYIFLFGVGGATYYCIELLYRGYSHFTMFLLGGLCFLCCGFISWLFHEYPLWVRMVWCSIGITVLELLGGLLLNVWLRLGIWDYSQMPLNLSGQICIPYMFLWFALSLPALWLNHAIRVLVFQQKPPRKA